MADGYDSKIDEATEGLKQALKGERSCRFWSRYSWAMTLWALVMGFVLSPWYFIFAPFHVYLAMYFKRLVKSWQQSAYRWRQLIADWHFLSIVKASYPEDA